MDGYRDSSPFLHVLIPAFGRADLLHAALAHAQVAFAENLTDGHVAVAVVDDATPDCSVERTVAQFPWCEYTRNAENVGISRNFAACAERSRGEYTVFCGTDDTFLPGYVDRVLELAKSLPDADVLAPPVIAVTADGQRSVSLVDRMKRLLTPRGSGGVVALRGDVGTARMLIGDFLYFPSLAWKTATLRTETFDSRLSIAVDLDLLLRLLLGGGTIAVGNGPPVFSYGRHAGSASSTAIAGGQRYAEEMTVHRWAAARAMSVGWRRSVVCARLAPTVRAHRLMSVLTPGRGRRV